MSFLSLKEMSVTNDPLFLSSPSVIVSTSEHKRCTHIGHTLSLVSSCVYFWYTGTSPARLSSGKNLCNKTCDSENRSMDGEREGDGRIKRESLANHYGNQLTTTSRRMEGHQFCSTDRLLDSTPSSPSISAGHHHQGHLQHQQRHQRLLQSSNPRAPTVTSVASSILFPSSATIVMAATDAHNANSAKYLMRTLSAAQEAEFLDHQLQQEKNDFVHRSEVKGNTSSLYGGSLQRNHSILRTMDRESSRIPGSSSLISSLISSFTNSRHHLKDRKHPVKHLNQTVMSNGLGDISDDPSLSLELMERRVGEGNRVVTFDLPAASPNSQASNSFMLYANHHMPLNPVMAGSKARRYSLSGDSSMPASSSTSCLISDSSFPAIETDFQKRNPSLIASSPSHHQLAMDRTGLPIGSHSRNFYATLRPSSSSSSSERKGTIASNPLIDHYFHQVDGLSFKRSPAPTTTVPRYNVPSDQNWIQHMKQKQVIRNASLTNANCVSTCFPLNSTSHSNTGVLHSNEKTVQSMDSCERKNTSNPNDPNALWTHKPFEARDYERSGRELQQQDPHALRPSHIASSSGLLSDAKQSKQLSNHQQQQQQQQQEQNRIKYSPDEGLGDERSEFEVV